MLNLVLFGPPGAGKGTQSEMLIKKYNLIHLSTGDILRGEIANGTELGVEAKKLMDKGILVPDEVVVKMIKNKINANPNAAGFIFDGFPRTQNQAASLDNLLAEQGDSITALLSLNVSNEELIKRLLNRGKDSGRPDDANREIIAKRIEEYNNKTAPLIDFYKTQNKYYTTQGVGTKDEIFDQLCEAVNGLLSS